MKKYVFADILDINDEPDDTRRDLADESANSRELTRLAEDPNSGVRIRVARNPSTPPEILAKLAEDPYVYVVTAVAQNPNTPSDVLYSMAANSPKLVQSYIALNPNCPENIMQMFIDDNIEVVLENLAENPNVPENIMRQIYENNISLGITLAENPNVSDELKQEIVDDLGLQSLFMFYIDSYSYDIRDAARVVRSVFSKYGVELLDFYDGYDSCTDGTTQVEFYGSWISDDALRSEIGEQIMHGLNAADYSVDGWEYETFREGT